MTYPVSVRQEALARLAAGESARGVARALRIDSATVVRWNRAAGEQMQHIAAPVRERIGNDAAVATLMCMTRTVELLPHQESIRDTAYATKCLSDIALDWLYGRKGAATVTVDNSQYLALPADLTLDELRSLAGQS